MKKFISLVVLAATMVASQAQTWVTASLNNDFANTNQLVVAGSFKLNSLILVGGNAGRTVQFYDNSTATNKVTISGDYVTISQVKTTNATQYITLGGITNYTTNVVLVATYTTNSGPSALTLPVVATYYVPASTQVSVDNPGLMFSRGLVAYVTTTNVLTTPISLIGSYTANP